MSFALSSLRVMRGRIHFGSRPATVLGNSVVIKSLTGRREGSNRGCCGFVFKGLSNEQTVLDTADMARRRGFALNRYILLHYIHLHARGCPNDFRQRGCLNRLWLRVVAERGDALQSMSKARGVVPTALLEFSPGGCPDGIVGKPHYGSYMDGGERESRESARGVVPTASPDKEKTWRACIHHFTYIGAGSQ